MLPFMTLSGAITGAALEWQVHDEEVEEQDDGNGQFPG
jgi:hypothetical protein